MHNSATVQSTIPTGAKVWCTNFVSWKWDKIIITILNKVFRIIHLRKHNFWHLQPECDPFKTLEEILPTCCEETSSWSKTGSDTVYSALTVCAKKKKVLWKFTEIETNLHDLNLNYMPRHIFSLLCLRKWEGKAMVFFICIEGKHRVLHFFSPPSKRVSVCRGKHHAVECNKQHLLACPTDKRTGSSLFLVCGILFS